MSELSIGDVVERSGVAEGTLRMWERRHGFPVPERRESGHRRYTEEQLEQVRTVARLRAAGLSLPAAIARAGAEQQSEGGSLFAALRRRYPQLESSTISKPILIALSWAIEDESLARADQPLLFAAFQRERFYRQAERRWRALAEGAACAVVFADFPRPLNAPGRPIEVPIARTDPLAREWAIVSSAPGHSACLVGREPPGSAADDTSARRVLEVIWTVEPDHVDAATRICIAIAERSGVALPAEARARDDTGSGIDLAGQLRLATAVTTRTFAYLSR